MNRFLLLLLFLNVSNLKSQLINFPDLNFKTKLLQSDTNNYIANGVKIDINNDGEITQSEALAVYGITLQGNFNIWNITGIEYFTNITLLAITVNSIQAADLSTLSMLDTLDFGANQISSINLNGCSNLRVINLGGNQLTSVDFSTLAALKKVIIGQNLLTHLDFSNNPLFNQLRCDDNLNLSWINIRNNQSQVFSGSAFSGCWNNIPNLSMICVDDNEVVAAQNFFANCGVTQAITIATDCSLDIKETEKEQLVIYPNPSSDGMFTLSFDDTMSNGTIEVYNLLGQKVTQDTIQNSAEHLLNLPKATGTYILRINNGEQQMIKRITIK